MRKAAAWKLLGIAPTTDTREIRRAYAAVLKAGDYDNDAKAFMALREARDYALNAAQWADEPEEDIDDDEAGEGDFEFVSWQDEEGAAPIAVAEAAPPSPFEAKCRALYDALFDEGVTAELEPLLQAVLTDPKMDEIGTHADAEIWLSEIMANSIPRSDRLILPMGRFFGWQARVGQIGLPWSVEYLVRRQKALYFFDAVQVKGHRFYREWKELTTPAQEGSKRGWGLRRANVMALLETVRRDFPDLESCFDEWRVALWDTGKPASTWSWRTGWLWPFFAIQILLAIGRCSNDVSPPQTTVPPIEMSRPDVLSDKKADLDVALLGTGLTADQIEKANPLFYAALGGTWQTAFDVKRDKWDFVADVKDRLNDHYFYGADTSPYDLIAERRKLDRDMAKLLRSTNVDTCNGYFKGVPAPAGAFPKEFYDGQKALIARTILEVSGPVKKTKGSRQFSIPGVTVARVEALTKLSPERVAKAFQGEGSPSDNCNVRIALIDAALEAPRADGLKLLRAL